MPSDPAEERQEDTSEVVDRWGPSNIGAARDPYPRGPRCRERDRETRLKHQGDTSRRAHIKGVTATDDGPRAEDDIRRANRQALELTAAEGPDGTQSRHMLSRETRIRPPRANPNDADRDLLQGAERRRHSEELTSTLAMRTIDLEHRA